MDDAAALGLERPGVMAPKETMDRLRAALTRDAVEAGALAAGASEAQIVASLIALVPDAIAVQGRAGIPDEVTRSTLLDVGRKQRLYGARAVLPWLLEVMRGDIVELGRLQVARQPDRYGHAIHIPETGALVPAEVDRSLACIAAFTGATRLQCTSWLLDPLLQAELPGSNIASFARRFTIVDGTEPTPDASREAARFVFRDSLERVRDPREVEPRTRLERIVAEHLRAGFDWSEPTGTLDPSAAGKLAARAT